MCELFCGRVVRAHDGFFTSDASQQGRWNSAVDCHTVIAKVSGEHFSMGTQPRQQAPVARVGFNVDIAKTTAEGLARSPQECAETKA